MIMESVNFEKFDRTQVTDEMLSEASQLFSESYGVWGKGASKIVGGFAKPGDYIL